MGVERPLSPVGSITLLKGCLTNADCSWKPTLKHIMRTLAALHKRSIAVFVVDSLKNISARCACPLICDAIRSKATKGWGIGPWVSCELVTVCSALEPKGVAIEFGG